MDKQEARSLLTEQLATYRARSYADLVAMIGQDDCIEISSPSGQLYQVEYGAFWDNKPGGNVRVILSIDDGTFRAAFSPLTDSFIKAPDGTFIGED
jgi:hypothetical protein